MTEQEYRDAMYAKAAEVRTTDDFAALIREMEQDEFDYGRIVYACAAAAIAGFNVMNRTKNGGITGFQAGCLMWEMVKKFGMFSEGPLKIIDYGKLLYPQSDDDFAHDLSAESMAELQKRATDMLSKDSGFAHPAVMERWREIAAGDFPDFIVASPTEEAR